MKSIAYVFIFCYTGVVINAYSLQKRIYQGVEANEGEFPYQGRLYVNDTYRGGCGLVSKYHCVTAAHCVEDVIQYGWNVIVKVGSVHLNEGKSHNVRRVSHFPGFSRNSSIFFPHDIGMTYLVEPVEISPHVQLIGLPYSYSELNDDVPLIVTGFGHTGKNQPLSPILMKLETRKIGIRECQSLYSKWLRKTHLCTRNPHNNGCYYGDGGNPLVDETKSTLIGVLSGIKGSYSLGDPDIFTKISHYMGYIKAEINYNPNREGKSRLYPSRNFPDIHGNIYPVPHDLEKFTAYVID